jgi:hypothetical protein
VAQLILPTSRNTFYYQNFNTPGAKKPSSRSTPPARSRCIASAHRGFAGDAAQRAVARARRDDYVMKERASRLWFERTNNLLFRERYEANANFAAQNYNNWQSLGAFGNATRCSSTGSTTAGIGGTRGLRYKAVPFGETFYGENHQGKVDRIIRWFRLTAYQAVQKWGRDQLPEALVAPLDQHSPVGLQLPALRAPRGDGYDPEALGRPPAAVRELGMSRSRAAA